MPYPDSLSGVSLIGQKARAAVEYGQAQHMTEQQGADIALGPLSQAVNTLDNQISGLGIELERLEGRMSMFLMPAQPEGVEPKTNRPSGPSPIVDVLMV